jgi:sulfoacetaldehyde acetyltransferase
LNIPRDYLYGEAEFSIARPIRVERGPGGTASLEEAAALLARARFPVIVSGGGVVHHRKLSGIEGRAGKIAVPL